VLNTPSRLLLAIALTGIIHLAPPVARAQSAAAPGAKQPEWKDRTEYDLYQAASTGKVPAENIEKLDQWKKQYPETQFKAQRDGLYLTNYVALGKVQDAVNAAKDVLATDPNSFTALYYITLYTPALAAAPVPADVLDQGDKAAQGMLANLDKQKPATMSDAQWDTTKKPIAAVAHTTLGWTSMQRKDYDKAENEFKQSLALNPANGDVAYWLGFVEAAEKKPEKIPEALFYYARAASYDGTGAASPGIRKASGDYLDKAYASFHGSTEGLDQLKQQAKTTPAPPPNFNIVSIADIEKDKIEKENALLKEHPELALFKNLKDTLTGPDGASYFNDKMKDTTVPGLKGSVISMEPATNPKTVVLGVLDPKTPDVTLHFDAALPGKVDAGTELTFDCQAQSYTASPFMVVCKVDKTPKGWTGKAAAPVHHRPVHH
jgi:tetratricopeptide (TPR) repeat protein